MKSRIKSLTQLGNVIPAIVVSIAIVISLEPKPFGVEIADRQMFLALFAFLGADAIIERSGRLYSMDKKLDTLSHALIGPASLSNVLRTRASFERMDVILDAATQSIAIIGINIEGAIAGRAAILDLARAGGTVKLLAMDPDGACIPPSAAMSGVDPEIRREKIRQNLNLLKHQLSAELNTSTRRRVTLSVVDKLLPVSVVALDSNSRHGSLIVQHHLTATPAESAPMLVLSKESDSEWFHCYLNQCNVCFEGAREW